MKQLVQKLRVTPIIITMSVAIVAGIFTTTGVYAHEGMTDEEHSHMTESERSAVAEQERTTRESRAEIRGEARTKEAAASQTRKEVVREKLDAQKLKACEKRQTNINTRTARIAERGTKHLELFTKIAERVQAFYASKGNSLANYDELVADVAAKKAAAESAVAVITDSSATFNCSEGNPKQLISSYKEALDSRHAALKEYQTAVKNLIVGVKSVNGNTASTSPTSKETE